MDFSHTGHCFTEHLLSWAGGDTLGEKKLGLNFIDAPGLQASEMQHLK